jgi:hypothetical protein
MVANPFSVVPESSVLVLSYKLGIYDILSQMYKYLRLGRRYSDIHGRLSVRIARKIAAELVSLVLQEQC